MKRINGLLSILCIRTPTWWLFKKITLNEAGVSGLALVLAYVESFGNRPAKYLLENSMVLILGANPRQTQRPLRSSPISQLLKD